MYPDDQMAEIMSADTHRIATEMPVDLAAMEPVRGALASLTALHGVQATVAARMQIVLDECVSNIIRHGFADTRPGDARIAITMTLGDGKFAMMLNDGGLPFDPSKPVYGGDRAHPRLGGRGLDLVAAICDSIEYRREGQRNLLTVTKAINTASAATRHQEGTAMGPGLTIEEERRADGSTVSLGGRIDSGNAPHLTEHLVALVKDGAPDVVIDLSRLEYLTSAGFRTLLVVGDAAEDAGGSLSLANMSGEVKELFDLSGLTQAFRIV
ncbi:MAG: STAS domain-containing protein [Rhodobacteraceae bacterium]|nr:MAG: STAS domain-containing protein [Paracoccaceae bacterium]